MCQCCNEFRVDPEIAKLWKEESKTMSPELRTFIEHAADMMQNILQEDELREAEDRIQREVEWELNLDIAEEAKTEVDAMPEWQKQQEPIFRRTRSVC